MTENARPRVRNKTELINKVEKARRPAEGAPAGEEAEPEGSQALSTVSDFDDFAVGDVVDVHISIREGEKERVQVFTGLVISRKGSGMKENFTVRRVVGVEGVERVFPIHSPSIKAVKVTRRGKVKRAKLYYMRGRTGKQARIAEKREYGGDRASSTEPNGPGQDKKEPPVE